MMKETGKKARVVHPLVSVCGPVLLFFAPLFSRAEFYEGDYAYEVAAGQASIVGYLGAGRGALSITNILGGCPVTEIGSEAFAECAGLTSVTIPACVAAVGRGAFRDCTALTHATFLNDLSRFSACSAFGDCGGALKSVAVGDTVAEIGGLAFARCSGLTNVVIGAGARRITGGAFYFCTNLTAFSVDADNDSFVGADGVLFDKALTQVVQYPAGRAGDYAIPSGVTGIGDHAFAGCAGLAGVAIPLSVTNVGDFAFASCGGLSSVTVPARVACIGGAAFAGFTILAGEPVSLDVAPVGQTAFSAGEGSGLTEINVDEGSACYSSTSGVLFNKSRTLLIQYPAGRAGSYTVPDGVTDIAASAFRACNGLTALAISAGVADIQPLAFQRCTNLVRVTIAASVTNIGYWAFLDCASLAGAFFGGDAPGVFGDEFVNTPATLYYLPDTAGWGTEFCGRPALLWNPRVKADADFGFTAGRFGFSISGTANIPVAVEAATNLSSGAWTPLLTGSLGSSGLLLFSDPSAAGYPSRFYRIVWPQL